jgi:hypothetical protein
LRLNRFLCIIIPQVGRAIEEIAPSDIAATPMDRLSSWKLFARRDEVHVLTASGTPINEAALPEVTRTSATVTPQPKENVEVLSSNGSMFIHEALTIRRTLVKVEYSTLRTTFCNGVDVGIDKQTASAGCTAANSQPNTRKENPTEGSSPTQLFITRRCPLEK